MGGLYVKNKVLYKPLSKETVIKITKALRKPLQAILQKVSETYERVKSQVPPDQYKMMVESEEGMNINVQIR